MTMMKQRPFALLSLVFVALLWPPAMSFSPIPRAGVRSRSNSRLFLLDEDGVGWSGRADTEQEVDSFYKALEERKEELKRGIGKRYIVRTQKGFLNVHSDISKGPYATHNIVGKLHDGDIVTSVNRIGDWVRHDKGGWSMARHDGFLWLQPLKE